MISGCHYLVSWSSKKYGNVAKHMIYGDQEDLCIKVARLMSNDRHVFQVEITEVNSGKLINWGTKENDGN